MTLSEPVDRRERLQRLAGDEHQSTCGRRAALAAAAVARQRRRGRVAGRRRRSTAATCAHCSRLLHHARQVEDAGTTDRRRRPRRIRRHAAGGARQNSIFPRSQVQTNGSFLYPVQGRNHSPVDRAMRGARVKEALCRLEKKLQH